ncbi:MAG: NAD-dependent epimerase/dehydratase family protein [bacterium]
MLLVTGYRGFIGTKLCEELKKQNIDFVGYDLIDGNDIRNKCQLDRFFEENQITRIIHLAALAGVRRGELYPEEYISTNILGTLNVADLAEKHKCERLVFFSSSSVYGKGSPPITENAEKIPRSLYGITKATGENIIKKMTVVNGIIVRPFTVYGENGRRDEVVYKWLNQIKNNIAISVYGDGTSERGYVYIDDLVGATIKLLNIEMKGGTIDFNLGGNEVIKLSQIIEAFLQHFPKMKLPEYLKMPACDIEKNYADCSKAEILLGFSPKPNFIKNLYNILKIEKKNL